MNATPSQTPIDQAVRHVGTDAELARLLGITRSAVSQWRTNGIPAKRAAEIERITGVSRKILCPEVFA